MCGLFGFVNYSGGKIADLQDLTNALADESSVRGTDATGIALSDGRGLRILKDSKPAYQLYFKHNDDIKALIGHTRHSTQGSEKDNYNNHPFWGKAGKTHFALAHNGVLMNDKTLRKKHHLPKTKIETDSYVAVQLIERKKQLSTDALRFMAEELEGSFSFSILDEKGNVYLVKGDSPLYILHFPDRKIYVFASTEEILYKALVDSPLFHLLREGCYQRVELSSGTILKISPNGLVVRGSFRYTASHGANWWEFGACPVPYADSYIEELKAVAGYYRYAPEQIDEWLADGFSPEEIEEYLYCGLDGEI